MAMSIHQNLIELSTQPDSRHWDDFYFFTHYVSIFKRYNRPTLDTTILHAKYFLNYYISGVAEPSIY